MKKIFTVFFVFLSVYAFSQKVDYDKIILPNTIDSVSISEKLVQLAWQNYPANEVITLGRETAKKNVSLARFQFLEKITGNFNVTEFTIKEGLFAAPSFDPTTTVTDENGKSTIVPNFPPASAYLPRYTFGLSVSLGDFITTPMKVKREKIALKVVDAQINNQKIKIRSEVLKRYQIYLTSIEVLKLRVKALEEAHLIHLLVTKKFKKGEAILEDYNKSFLTYNQATEAKIQSESEVYLTKNNLEEMIGVSLDEVTGNKFTNTVVAKKGDTLISPTGLKYIVTEPGFGERPKPGQTVKVFYTGKFMNGKEFENNLKDDPFKITLGVQQVIQGWEEGILHMKEGERGTLVIPARLAYGHQGIKDPSNEGAYLVPPDTPVIYEIELVDVK